MSSSGDALDDPRAEERRHEHLVVGRDRRASAPGSVDAVDVVGALRRARAASRPVGTRPKSGSSLAAALHRPSRRSMRRAGPRTRPCRRTGGPRRPRAGRARRSVRVSAAPPSSTGISAEPERVQLLEVLAHDQRALHEQAAHADGVGVDLLGLGDHLGDRHLDAEVVHLVAVVGEDDVDEVLADVVDVALDGGEHDPALRRRCRRPSPCAARGRRPAVFIVSADCSTNGSCIWPEPNSSPTTFMPVEQHVVDDVERRRCPAASASSRSAVEAVAVAVDDAVLQALLDRPAGAVLLLGLAPT